MLLLLQSFITFSTCINYFSKFLNYLARSSSLDVQHVWLRIFGWSFLRWWIMEIIFVKGFGAIEITGILKRIFYGEFWKQGTGFLAFELLESSSFKRKLDDWLVSFWVIGVFFVQEKVGWPHRALSDFSSAHFFTCYNSLACFAL